MEVKKRSKKAIAKGKAYYAEHKDTIKKRARQHGKLETKGRRETKASMIKYNNEHVDDIIARNKEKFVILRAIAHDLYLRQKAG